MLSISSKKSNTYINIYNDERYKMMLGYMSYYIDNIIKYRNNILQFKDKEKVYKVLNPYNYKIINQTEEKIIDIYTAFQNKYKTSYDSQKYYQAYEIIKLLNIHNAYSEVNEFNEIFKLLKIKTGNDFIICDINNNYNALCDLINSKLNKQGTFIIKIRSLLSNNELLFINALCNSFETVDIYKPLVGNIWLSDKYLICKKYKNKVIINNKVDIGILNEIQKLNNTFNTQQTIDINKVVNYIIKRNYFSDEYYKYLDEQKEAHNKWIKEFLK